MRGSIPALACAVLALSLAAVGSAAAATEVYQYRVIHPTYGEIGTYTNVVDHSGDVTDVRSELHIAVRIVGVVVYRQEAQRVERWRNDRLVGFDGVTITNGNRVEVHGAARGSNFAVTTPRGTVLAPGNIHPSNPWSPMVLNSQVMLSTRTGAVIPARVSGGEEASVSLGGNTLRLRQYEIDSDKRQFAWFDDRGVPMAFRTVEDGTPIDFILSQARTE
jgi:hypothetical protein